MQRYFLFASLLLISLCPTLHAQAPDTLWTKTYGTAGDEALFSIDQTADGGFIMSGTSEWGTGSDDYWLVRTEASGDTVWTRTYGGPGADETQSGQLTTDGGYIMAGLGEMWLIRTNENGDTLWTLRSGGPGGSESPHVALTNDGGYIITGNFPDEVNHAQVGIVKVDDLGNILWTKTYGDPDDEFGSFVQPTADNGYVILGYKDITYPNHEFWLLKTDAAGDTTWTTVIPTANGEANVVRQTADGGYAIFGLIFGTLAAPDNDAPRDWLLIKTDASGNVDWSQTYGSLGDDQSMDMIITDDDGFLLTGWSHQTDLEDADLWLVQTDASGVVLWDTYLDRSGFDVGTGLLQLGVEEYAVVGLTDSSAFGDAGGLDGWLVRFGAGPDPFEQDSLALVALYNSTDGANWADNSGWLDPDSALSTWYGVTVTDGRVTRIGLDVNGLSGTIPASIGDLTALNYLSMYQNELTGTIPEAIGNLTNLTELNLGSNDLTGSIPDQIGNLVKIESLNLYTNMLSGMIPDVFGNLDSLISLLLMENQLEGPIPPSIGDMSKLGWLMVHNNQLSGEIPAALGYMPNINTLWLQQNQFTGAVPESFSNLATCDQLLLGNNQFTSLPDLSGLWDSSLYALFVYNNRLTFEDLEPNMPHPDSSGHTFAYSPQDSVGTEKDTTIIVGSNLDISVQVGGTANLYQWMKNGETITDSAAGNTYTINNAALADYGAYSCIITNTIATELDLFSRPVHVNVIVDPFEADSLALVALYNSTGGANWTNNTGWLVPDSTLDTWFGIKVANGRVFDVRLSNNNLVGPIPPAIGDLTALEFLYLGGNQLTGAIPGEIGNLTALETLYLDNNQFTGTIPVEIGDLASILTLNLNGNELSGEIPAVIGNLGSLMTLSLSENKLTGAIPASIGNLTAMWNISLRSNELSGEIPPAIGNLVNLRGLDMTSNQLTGSIPSEIVNFAELIGLRLQDNKLTGPIPASIGTHPKLRNLDLSDNELNGAIPPEIGNDTSLAYVNLGNNQLSGPIPPEIGKLVILDKLILTSNQFTTLPSTIDSLTYLTWLQLGDNQLTTLPAEIGSLPSLTNLSLSFNLLDSLPDLSGDTSLASLVVDNNQLTFEDIEPLIGLGIDCFLYSLQDSVGSEVDTTVVEGTDLVLTISVGGSANHYQWMESGVYPIGIDSAALVLDSVKYGRFYTCRITNDIATELTLCSRPFNVTVTPLSVTDKPAIPEEYALHPAYPNPFNPVSTIRYDLPKASDVSLVVYDIMGREVVRLVDRPMAAGYHSLVWNGRDCRGREVPTGLYIARLCTPGYTRSIKLVLLK